MSCARASRGNKGKCEALARSWASEPLDAYGNKWTIAPSHQPKGFWVGGITKKHAFVQIDNIANAESVLYLCRVSLRVYRKVRQMSQMKRYVVFHSAGVSFANGLHEIAEVVSNLDCRHYFVLDSLDDISIFVDMVDSLSLSTEFLSDLSDDRDRNEEINL